LTTSMTRIIKSMICAPPMTVWGSESMGVTEGGARDATADILTLINDACPGQSTNVICILS
jgi:hypothetical protein